MKFLEIVDKILLTEDKVMHEMNLRLDLPAVLADQYIKN